VSEVDEWTMIMGHWWNVAGRGKRWFGKKNLSHCNSDHHRSVSDWLGIEQVYNDMAVWEKCSRWCLGSLAFL